MMMITKFVLAPFATFILTPLGAAFAQTTTKAPQTSLDPASCLVPGQVSTFSGCSTFYSSDSFCSLMLSTNSAAFQSCYCEQGLLSAIFECQNEQRLCAGLAQADAIGESAVSLWHGYCDTAISFKPTTPAISSITRPYDTRCDVPLNDACETGAAFLNSCGASYTGSALTSCFCQEPVLSAAFTCDYIANVTCYNLPLTSSNLWGNGFCPNFSPFYSSMLTQEASYSSVLVSLANASPFATASAVTPSQTQPSIPSGVSTATMASKTSSGVARESSSRLIWAVAPWLAVLAAL